MTVENSHDEPAGLDTATTAPLPHNSRWDEVSAQILARQEADRRKQPKPSERTA